MNHNQIQEIATKHGLGRVHFQFNTSKNSPFREFEVGYVSVGRSRELFCKRGPDSNPDQFYLCNEYAKLEEKPTRDQKLEEIARGCLCLQTLTLDESDAEIRMRVVDLKQALQLAYKAGQDSK
jgi:hypothetical protein